MLGRIGEYHRDIWIAKPFDENERWDGTIRDRGIQG